MLDKIKKIPPIFYVLPLIFVAILIAWNVLPMDEWMKQMQEWVKSLGVWGYVAFAAIYIIATVALLPGSPLSIAGGLIFSWWGVPLVWAAAVVGASISFLIGRYLARERVVKLAENNEKFSAVDKAVEDEGWKIVLLVRLSPLVPFNLQNYFFGTTSVSFVHYIWATAVGIIPGTFAYVYIGIAGGAAGGGGSSTIKWVLLGVGLLATVVVTWFVSRKAKDKLENHGLDEENLD